MKIQKSILLLMLLFCIGLLTYAQQPATKPDYDFKKYYDRFEVDGSFVLYDQQEERFIFHNRKQFSQEFSPASTFKICNSLIGIETGVITDENFIIHWDSVTRQNPNWNNDQDLKTAFKNSTVWYYQELARRVGAQRMKYWLDKAHYGNADTSGGIDRFWLTGGLRITPGQQIDFLKRLYNNQLPFSQRTMDMVKKIMIAEQTASYIMRAKTGWGSQDSIEIGWYVGYLETKGNVYYFANCIQTSEANSSRIAKARTQIVYDILTKLDLINNTPLKISHLKGDFYVFTTYRDFKGSTFPANGLYLVTDAGVVMIDTPWDTTQFQPLVDSIEQRHHKKVLMCIATHSHEDRTGGLAYYRQKGIQTYTTLQTDRICREKHEKRAEFTILNDTVFTVGQYTFQTYYPGAGHTPDNIVLWFAKEKILYGGCFVKSFEAVDLGNLNEADTKAWPASIKNIQNKFGTPEYIIPGHQSWTSNKSLEHTIKLLREYEKRNKH